MWILALTSLPVMSAVSSTRLGLDFYQEASIDTRLPTISGCFGRNEDGEENTWSQELCTFGFRGSENRLLIVGDSTVASMTDGVVAAASGIDIEIVAFPSRGCTFTSRFPYSYEWCDEYFTRAIDLTSRLQPKGIIVSNYLSRMDLPDRRIRLANGELPQSLQQRLDSTIESLNEALVSVRRLVPDVPILIIQEVPNIPFRRPSVLFDKSESPTVDRNSRGYLRQREYMTAVERMARTFSNVSVVNPETVLCRQSLCSAKSPNGRWLYMDSYHLNPRGSNQLTYQFREWIVSHLSGS